MSGPLTNKELIYLIITAPYYFIKHKIKKGIMVVWKLIKGEEK